MLPRKQFNRRCQWYNELGWPRINPKAKDHMRPKPFLGCLFGSKCNYLHPDDPGWSAGQMVDPQASWYPNGIRPRTPSPPRSMRYGTPDRDVSVKEEHVSPKLSFSRGESSRGAEQGRDRSWSRPQSPIARNESRNPYRGDQISSAISRPSYPRGRSISRSRSRSRSRERYPGKGRMREESRDGRRDRGKSREWESREYDRDRDRERNGWRQPTSSRFGQRPPSSPRGTIDPRQRMLNISERRRAGSNDYNSSRRPLNPEREEITSSAKPQTPFLPSTNNASSTDRAPSTTQRDSLDGRNLNESVAPGPSLPPGHLTQRDGALQLPPPVAASNTRLPLTLNPPPPPDSAATEASFVSQQIAPPPPDSVMSQTGSISQMPPPPNPLAVPQVPTLPKLVAAEADVGKKELMSFEERMKVWDQRIELLLEATNSRQRYQALAADVKELKRHTSSTHFTGLTATVQAAVLASVKDAETRCEAAKKHADTIMEKLYKADFWPVRKRPRTAQGDGAEEAQVPGTDWEEEHELMKNEVSDLNTAVRKIDQTLHEVVAFVSPRTRSTSVASTVVPSHQSRASVDVEMRDSTRAAKRRRVEDDVNISAPKDVSIAAGPSTPTAGTPIEASAPSAMFHDNLDVARLIRRVEQIETQLADLENLATQAEESVFSNMDDRLDTRLDEFRRDFKRRQTEAILALKGEVEQVNEDITEISTEMGELIKREGKATDQINAWKSEEDRLSTEVAEMKASFEQERARSDEMQAQLKACMEGMNAVNLLLQTSQRTPPPPPYSLSVDDIVEAIKPIVIDSVRGDLTNTMEEMRSNISKFVKANTTSTSQLEAMREKFAKLNRLPEVAHFLQNYTPEKPKTNGHPPP